MNLEVKPVRPMLGVKVDLDKLEYPVYASPKLDGIRAIVKDGVVFSRTGKPIPNEFIQFVFSNLNGADGELIVGEPNAPNVFQTTASGVMTKEGYPDVTYYIFDYWNDKENGIIKRLEKVKQYSNPEIRILDQTLIRSRKELDEYENKVLQEGYEGVILRKPNAIYKHSRSTNKDGALLKLKRFEDSEAIILEYKCLMKNLNTPTYDKFGNITRASCMNNYIPIDTLGSLDVKDINTGIVFNIGSGFTQAQRLELWLKRNELIGKIITYKYFPVGIKEAPRFPVFKGFRNKDDII